MSEIKSRELYVKHAGNTIAKATGFGIEINKETIQVTTLSDGDWQRVIGGGKNFSITTDGLVARGATAGISEYSDLLQSLVDTDTPLDLILSSNTEGDKYYKGKTVLSSLSQSGSVNEVITFSATFSGSGTLNQRVVDFTAPVLSSAVVDNAAPSKVVLTYNEALDTGSVPAVGDFVTSPAKTISSVTVSGSKVTVTTSTNFLSTDTITVSYTKGTDPIQDIEGNDAVNLSSQAVTNNII